MVENFCLNSGSFSSFLGSLIADIFPSLSVLAIKSGFPSSVKNNASGNSTSHPSKSILGANKSDINLEKVMDSC